MSKLITDGIEILRFFLIKKILMTKIKERNFFLEKI